MSKKIGAVLLFIGVFMLITAILLAFAVSGTIVPVLTLLSIAVNSAGIMLLRGKH